MTIIILGQSLAAPKRFHLDDRRTRAFAVAILLIFCSVLLLAGVALGRVLGDPRRAALGEIAALEAELSDLREGLARVRESARRDLDALAVRLAELHAHAARLNALGERLVESARLDPNEFDFRESPALGGPGESASSLGSEALSGQIDQLERLLDERRRQLELLSAILLDRELNAQTVPTGLPVKTGYRSSGFGRRIDPITGHEEFHAGIDFNGPRGSPIHAVADGVVVFSGRRPGYGNTVEIDHGNGYRTRYAHNDRNLVKVGDRVRVGDMIATMGRSGRTTGVHLHFEVWRHGRPVDPAPYLRGDRSLRLAERANR
ncbi:MAG: peptidase [Lysobacterales bacterium]|jgi:murein DD-endopeptidase MepM/ murein hydrolase activator NlpD|nr:MAG: peptidase [Xanthomonadales bacterium]